MICQRCNHEVDTAQSSCGYCGFVAHIFPSQASPVEEQHIREEDACFLPGALLERGRYRLNAQHGHQRWANGAYETHWKAQDLFMGEVNVIACELDLAEVIVATRQANLRAAMRTLFTAEMQFQIPTLTNVFRERGRDFFIFEAIEGETLLAHMQNTGQALPEQEIIECCLQITKRLEVISQHEPPLLHGLISPEHLLVTRTGQWFLTDFSVILASGAQQYRTDLDPSSLSPFSAPEVVHGMIDSCSDLYQLLATAYFGITGTYFSGAVPRGQSLSPYISPLFEAIFKKGLHPFVSQRYQQISALYQDLLTLRSNIGVSQHLRGPEQRESMIQMMERQEQRESMIQMMERQKQRGSMIPLMERPEQRGSIMPLMERPEQRGSMRSLMEGQKQRGSIMPLMDGPEQRGSMMPLMERLEQQKSVVLQEKLQFAKKIPYDLNFGAQIRPSGALPHEMPTRNLLPAPEELPPMQQWNDRLAAALWIGGIMICLLIPVFIK